MMEDGGNRADAQRERLLALLAWYRAMGVDAAVGAAPLSWPGREPEAAAMLARVQAPGGEAGARDAGVGLPASSPAPLRAPSQFQAQPHNGTQQRAAPPSPPAAPVKPSANPIPSAAAGPPLASPDEAVALAQRLSRDAANLDELKNALEGFEGCGLKVTAKQLCFARGAARAPLMIVGEAPGRDEDRAGQPFVGRAGQLLDKMLAAIGLDDTSVHITNIVYWRPPGNRTPTPQEALTCRPFLERQIQLVGPDVLLVLGGAAAKALFDTTQGIMRQRGQWRDVELGGRSLRALATLHPAYLLRTPAAKRLAWADLQTLREGLESTRGPS
ncbi:MAG: uracil-DNA glycosylase family protein [Pseudomonadota bacterium]